MTHIQYVTKRFVGARAQMIEDANTIIDEYADEGFALTLRQLYYQFVARGLIANQQREYQRLGKLVSDARLAGLISWDAIEDRTRNLRTFASWEDPAAILKTARDQYQEDPWRDQPFYVEAWIEKDAMVGVLEAACDDWRIPFFSCRGYTSQSELWRAGRRLRERNRNGQTPLVLHLGDHDPSGIDMTRDVRERLAMFAETDVEVRRLALNMDQVRRFNPPPNPAKLTDARAGRYLAEHGSESWELDALEPRTIRSLIDDAVKSVIDQDAWDEAIEAEDANRDRLGDLIEELEQGDD